MEKISSDARAALELVKSEDESDRAKTALAIDQFIDDWQDKRLPTGGILGLFRKVPKVEGPDPAETAVKLGALWGEQVVGQYNWRWAATDNPSKLLVVSPNGSYVIPVIEFVEICLNDPELDCTIMLSFNMLAQTPDGEQPDDGDNLMESVFRIVPKPNRIKSLAAARLPR